jgi:transposase-like protein
MNTTETNSEISKPAKRNWRKHSDEFKAHVIAQALQPHASLASVALANGINANMLRNWVHGASLASRPITASRDDGISPKLSFVQLPIQADKPLAAPPVPATSPIVEVQIQRGETRVVVSLPLIPDSAAWVREVLG